MMDIRKLQAAVRFHDADRAEQEWHEARSLAHPGNYEQFAGMTVQAARGAARRWGDSHPNYVKRAVRRA